MTVTIRPATVADPLTTYLGEPTSLDGGFDEAAAALVAELDGRVVGSLIYEAGISMPKAGGGFQDGTWIEHVWVDEDMRGQGIFRALLAELCRLEPRYLFIELGGDPSVRAAVDAWNLSIEHGSGDGYIETDDGRRFWGLYGAAGILFFHTDSEEDERFFLVLRSHASEDGGLYGIPGGARHLNETELAAALRETAEETGHLPGKVAAIFEHLFRPVPEWSYRTFVVVADERFEQSLKDWETDGSGWFTRAQMNALDVHPGVLAALAAFDADR